MIKFTFCIKIKTDVSYKLLLSLWVCIARHVQSSQNNKFVVSLQYLKENMKDEVEFKPADKYQRFLQIDTIILRVCGKAYPNFKK